MRAAWFHIAIMILLNFCPRGDIRAAEEIEELSDFKVTGAGPNIQRGTGALMWGEGNQVWIERAISVPLPRTVPMGRLQYVIEHRNRTPVDDDPFDNFLGFDNGSVKIGLGLRYGLLDNLDISIYRINGTVERFDTWQYGARYQPLREESQIVDAAVIGGVTVFTLDDEEDATGGFGGLLIGRSFTRYFYASLGGLYHSNSSSFQKTAADEKDSTALLGSVIVRLSQGFALVAETSVPLDGYDAGSVAWAGGLKFITLGHTFNIVAGNTQYISLDGLAAGTSFDDNEVVLGFSITRGFEIYDFGE